MKASIFAAAPLAITGLAFTFPAKTRLIGLTSVWVGSSLCSSQGSGTATASTRFTGGPREYPITNHGLASPQVIQRVRSDHRIDAMSQRLWLNPITPPAPPGHHRIWG
jgi:hypothetical protein